MTAGLFAADPACASLLFQLSVVVVTESVTVSTISTINSIFGLFLFARGLAVGFVTATTVRRVLLGAGRSETGGRVGQWAHGLVVDKPARGSPPTLPTLTRAAPISLLVTSGDLTPFCLGVCVGCV